MENSRKQHTERAKKFLRFLDRYAGIPIVYAAGLIRKKASSFPDPPKRIGILQFPCIGDTVLLGAVISDLRRTWPKSRIVFFCSDNNKEIAALLRGPHEIRILPATKPLRSAKVIESSGLFDLWLDFGSWPRIHALLSFLAKAACKIGFMNPGQYRHYIYDSCVMHRSDVHELENYRNLARAAGVVCESLPELNPNRSLMETLPGVNKKIPYVVIHMFPGGFRSYMKEWPSNCWLEVISELISRGFQVILTGAVYDQVRSEDITDITKRGDGVINFVGKLNLAQVASLLTRAVAVISVNTGIMHLASAVGSPLIAIHGPTSPLRWGPTNSSAVVITPENFSCAPCLNLGFEYKCRENRCTSSISPEVVIKALDKILD